MPLAGIVTLIAVALVVAALAIYLIWVAWLLRAVSFNLGTIIAGLRAIAFQTGPVGQRFQQINSNLAESNTTLSRVVDRLQRQAADAAADEPVASGDDGGEPAEEAPAPPAARKTAGRKATARKTAGRGPTGRPNG